MLSPNLSTERPWVVLVEDDELLGGQLSSALARALPELSIQCTPDADLALDLVRDSRSRLLITEAQTACVDGLALAACARRQRPELPLIFLTDARLSSSLVRVPHLSGSHLVDKPPRLEHFVGLVARLVEPAAAFHGELSASGVFELVQLAAMVAPGGALRLAGPAGSGAVWFEGGSVVHAAFAGERGTAAFRRLLGWRSGQFSIDASACAPERSVTTNTMALLLDAARALDEAGTLDEGVEPGGAGFEATEAAHEAGTRALAQEQADSGSRRASHVALRAVHAPDQLDEWQAHRVGCAADDFDCGLSAVWRKDYAAALPRWERAVALEPDNRLYQHNLARLRRLMGGSGERSSGGDV